MSEELVFEMGQFAAKFPTDRLYARNHMWAAPEDEAIRFGFSAYAVRLLQDVYFLEWIVDVGASLRQRQHIGSVESEKAESDLYSPIAGKLVAVNERLLSDPSHINVHTYGDGWLFQIDGPADDLLGPHDYMEHLAASWDVAQKAIKGQINEGD